VGDDSTGLRSDASARISRGVSLLSYFTARRYGNLLSTAPRELALRTAVFLYLVRANIEYRSRRELCASFVVQYAPGLPLPSPLAS
jgi:hypothetical protein